MPLVGDGVADDTAAIQALIDASGGGWVELPAGTFRTTADLTRRADGAYVAGVKLRGKHPKATTILADYNGNASTGAIIGPSTVSNNNPPPPLAMLPFSAIAFPTMRHCPVVDMTPPPALP